jgi:hypothetical protein
MPDTLLTTPPTRRQVNGDPALTPTTTGRTPRGVLEGSALINSEEFTATRRLLLFFFFRLQV